MGLNVYSVNEAIVGKCGPGFTGNGHILRGQWAE